MTKLSPAALTVWSAFLDRYEWEVTTEELFAVAAVLRAAADQVVPEEQRPPRRGMRPGGTGALSPDEGAEDQRALTRRQIIAIAAELEAQ